MILNAPIAPMFRSSIPLSTCCFKQIGAKPTDNVANVLRKLPLIELSLSKHFFECFTFFSAQRSGEKLMRVAFV